MYRKYSSPHSDVDFTSANQSKCSKKDPKAWPRIRRVVSAGTVFEIDELIWGSSVTNADLGIYVVPLFEERPKDFRYLRIDRPLAEPLNYPYTLAPKPEYLELVERPSRRTQDDPDDVDVDEAKDGDVDVDVDVDEAKDVDDDATETP